MLDLGLTFPIVNEFPILGPPMIFVALGNHPAIQIHSIVEGCEALIERGHHRRGWRRAWEFLDPNIPVIDFSSFRFQRDIALAVNTFLAAGDFLAIDGQLNDSIDAGYAIMVPLGEALERISLGKLRDPRLGASGIMVDP